jgi:hypothetical protein
LQRGDGRAGPIHLEIIMHNPVPAGVGVPQKLLADPVFPGACPRSWASVTSTKMPRAARSSLRTRNCIGCAGRQFARSDSYQATLFRPASVFSPRPRVCIPLTDPGSSPCRSFPRASALRCPLVIPRGSRRGISLSVCSAHLWLLRASALSLAPRHPSRAVNMVLRKHSPNAGQ